MVPAVEGRLATDLAHALVPLTGSVRDDETLFDVIGSASIVLIGDSTHGTHEFYRARAEITKRLIDDCGFTAVCIEADWPDAYRVNRYVRDASDDGSALAALGGFKRFPAWLWRNAEVLDFIAWLREYNDTAARMRRAKSGFYGLDLYSTSACVDFALDDRDGAVELLLDIQRRASSCDRMDDRISSDQDFYAEQSARVVLRAKDYYRATFDEPVSTSSVRATHMLDTLERLIEHLRARQGLAKVVVWTHTSPAGAGALARHRFGDRAVSIGFTTYTGTVTASSQWHAPEERKRVVPARGDSYEYLFHSMNVPRMVVPLRPYRPKLAGLPLQARERAIGVVYREQTDLDGNYFTARLIDQFDAICHFDVTRALASLE